MKSSYRVVLTFSVVFPIALSGCSTGAEDTEPSSPSTNSQSSDRPSSLTRDEFMEMMLEMEQCYKDHGADAEIFGWNPADDRRIVHRLNTSNLSPEQALEVEHECLDSGPSWAMTYFLEQEDPEMDSDFRASVLGCLSDRGHNVPTEVQNHYEMEESGAPRMEISDCIGFEMEKLDQDLYLYFGGVQW